MRKFMNMVAALPYGVIAGMALAVWTGMRDEWIMFALAGACIAVGLGWIL